jgi:hypothetical protein
MLGFQGRSVQALALSMSLALLPAIAGPAKADTGSVDLVIGKVGFIVGMGGGSGVLTFRGKNYPLKIGGVSFGATIGASRTEYTGRARHLRSPSDIAGTYSAIGAGAAVAAGAGAVTMQNGKGVVLELSGLKLGLEASMAISGMTVSLK